MRGARTLAWIAATGCCALAAPAARAAIVDDNPAAAAWGPGQVEVFLRGPGTSLMRSLRTPRGTWTPWQTIDGAVSSGPGAYGLPNGTTDLVVRGTDFNVYHRGQIGGSFGGWEGLGDTNEQSAIAVVRERGNNVLTIYARGPDNSVQEDYVTASGWSGWFGITGLTLSAPAAASRINGYVDVVVRGVDDNLYLNEWNTSAWSGWQGLGVSTQSAPAIVSRSGGTLDVFVRDSTGHILWRTFDGSAWSVWRSLPGPVGSAPAAAADPAGNIYLFARAGGDAVVNTFSRAGWSGWQLMHPPPVPARCTLRYGHMSARTHTVAYGRQPDVTGRVVNRAGGGLPGVRVFARTPGNVTVGTAVTRPDGTYRITLPRGHNRRVQVIVSLTSVNAVICSSVIQVRVRAGVRLSASRRVRPGGVVHFSGRLLGGPIPKHGKVIELQAFDGGRWRTFATPRARRHRHGRFSTAYRLRQTFGPRTFVFRARVRREADYPYVLGYSRKVRVRVT